MPTRTDERARLPHDRHRQPDSASVDEPRHFEARGRENTTPGAGPHAGFDEQLNPIDHEDINTHGSER